MNSSSAPLFPGFVVGAYAASPAHAAWNADAEDEFYRALDDAPEVAALELPWMGALHPHDDAWLHARFPQRMHAVLTDIP